MHEQLDRLEYAHTSFFTTAAAEALADELIARAPGDLSHAYLVSGGSEAVEAARGKVATQKATVERIGKQVTAQGAAVDQAKAQLASTEAGATRADLELLKK